MSETETLFVALRQSADGAVVDMLERMVRDAPDHALNKMNALDLAAKEGLSEERVIAALLNAVGLGMFEMTWSVMCPSCAGVLSANKSLKTLDRAQYNCARSEEHTSELQSRGHLVCRLLLDKKKRKSTRLESSQV